MRSSSGSSSSSSSSYDSQYFSAIPSPSSRDFTHHDAFFIVPSRDDLRMKSSATEAAPSSSFTYSQCSTLTPSPSTSRDRNTTHGVSINGFRSEDDNHFRPSWSTSIASTSTSQTSSYNPSPTSHDVFISFRGEDTRYGFVSHLRAAFERHSIRAYMDCDLERGNEIFSTLVVAIKQSKILLIVFSENYAESTWTLKELTEIMECNNNETQHVIPIFYKVTPSEVRHQRGNYETAFKKHKKLFKADNETVQKWRTAMTKAADVSGWVCSGSSEAKLVEEIAIYITRKLESKSRGGIMAEDIRNIIADTEPQGGASLLPSQNYSHDPNNSGHSNNHIPPQESFPNYICLPHGRNILGNLRLWRRENERLVLQARQEPDEPSTSHSPRTIVHSPSESPPSASGTALNPNAVKHGGESQRPVNPLNRLLQLLKEPSSIGMPQLKQIHSQTLRSIPVSHPQFLFLYSRILHFSSLADLHYANRVFNHFQNPNSFMWNTLIRAYARSTHFKDRAVELYRAMVEDENVIPDKHTYPFVLKACAYMFYFFEGKQMHGHILKLGLESDVHVCNSLIHFYATCGNLDLAQIVFDKMFERSRVSWNVLIDSYVRDGEFDTALKLFIQMQNAFEPDNYTMQSVISACAGLGALSLGLWAHAYILKKPDMDMANDVLINACLVDMYCRCGSIELAEQVFESMPDSDKDINSWNAMILGLAMHGKAEAALHCFNRMVKKTQIASPNSISFVSVLSACNHGGKVNEGLEYFNMMIKEYNIEPRIEHYGCLVDLLARAGRIEEALNLVSEMPMKPDAVIWRSLLDACCKQQASVELSEELAKQIFESSEESVGSGVYVLLSKVYASARRWNDVGLLRKLMTDKGVIKEPGCSLVEIDGVTHEFFSGDTSHPQSEDIYKFLKVIDEKLESIGYSPDYSGAAMVDDEIDGGKQSTMRLHSERLALAFGLLSSKPGVPIRIFKNLRVCNDCHKVTKLISRIYNVEIIVRDRVRFHHFKDGTCSCKGYW